MKEGRKAHERQKDFISEILKLLEGSDLRTVKIIYFTLKQITENH